MSGTTAWPNDVKEYALGDVIGHGATAYVIAATCPSRKDEKCAIKRILLEKCQTSLDELNKEIAAMAMFQHENIVKYYTSFVVRSELWMVLELCDGGSFLDIIKQRIKNNVDGCKNGVFDEAVIATSLNSVLLGLDYLHTNNHIHRDIKAGNILLKRDGTVKIADFGVAGVLGLGKRGDKGRHTFVGTPCWMAPEVMEQPEDGYDHKADIWSVGITSIELATGTAPYHKFQPMKVIIMTLTNDPPYLDLNSTEKDQYKMYGKSFRKFLTACLQKDPNERPSARQLLKQDFIKNKSKDAAYLAQKLLTQESAVRPQKVKRVAGASGRFHKTEEGGWEWSDEECDNGDLGGGAARTDEATTINTFGSTMAHRFSSGSLVIPVIHGEKQPDLTKTLNLALRLRNDRGELNDINFDFTIGLDNVNTVSQELVENGLINGIDRVVVAANVEKAIEQPIIGASHLFSINHKPNDVPSEKLLVGYAQLTLNEIHEGVPTDDPAAADAAPDAPPEPEAAKSQ